MKPRTDRKAILDSSLEMLQTISEVTAEFEDFLYSQIELPPACPGLDPIDTNRMSDDDPWYIQVINIGERNGNQLMYENRYRRGNGNSFSIEGVDVTLCIGDNCYQVVDPDDDLGLCSRCLHDLL